MSPDVKDNYEQGILRQS